MHPKGDLTQTLHTLCVEVLGCFWWCTGPCRISEGCKESCASSRDQNSPGQQLGHKAAQSPSTGAGCPPSQDRHCISSGWGHLLSALHKSKQDLGFCNWLLALFYRHILFQVTTVGKFNVVPEAPCEHTSVHPFRRDHTAETSVSQATNLLLAQAA